MGKPNKAILEEHIFPSGSQSQLPLYIRNPGFGRFMAFVFGTGTGRDITYLVPCVSPI